MAVLFIFLTAFHTAALAPILIALMPMLYIMHVNSLPDILDNMCCFPMLGLCRSLANLERDPYIYMGVSVSGTHYPLFTELKSLVRIISWCKLAYTGCLSKFYRPRAPNPELSIKLNKKERPLHTWLSVHM